MYNVIIVFVAGRTTSRKNSRDEEEEVVKSVTAYMGVHCCTHVFSADVYIYEYIYTFQLYILCTYISYMHTLPCEFHFL